MFDVSWSDPERETVRQRKERKEKEATNDVHSSSSSVRSSKSSKSNDSVRQSTRVSLLTFLNGNRKEGSKKDAMAKGPSIPSRSRKKDSNPSRRYSSFTEKTDISLQEELSESTTPRAVDDGYYMTAPDIHHSTHTGSTNGLSPLHSPNSANPYEDLFSQAEQDGP